MEVETLEEETSYRFEEVISVRRVVVLFMWADSDWVVERSIGVFGGGRDNFGRGADTGRFKIKSETTRMVAIMAEDRVADDLVETRVIGRCRRRRRRRVNRNGDLSHKCHGKMIDGVVRRTKGGDTLTGCSSRGGGRLLGRSGAAIRRLTSMRVGHGRHGGREKYGDGRRRRGKGWDICEKVRGERRKRGKKGREKISS